MNDKQDLNEQLLYRYNPWWEGEDFLKDIYERPELFRKMEKALNSKNIIILTGLRRVGKTCLMKLMIKFLLKEKKVSPKKIFYISLDDYLLADKSILEIVDEYRKIHKISFKEHIYLFLDEITFVKNFEQQLKNLYDSHKVKIFASSSSASVLKSKKAFLTGRCSVIEVLPLDFQEFLQFKKIKLSKSDLNLMESYFEDFLKSGGMPEYVLKGDMEYLKELVDDIIYKDVVALHGIKNPQILKDFFLLLMERAGKAVSINKLANIMKISVDSAKRYLQMFVDTYLIYLVPRFGKTNEKILSAKKIYSADIGIRNLFTGFRDKGSLFENYVFLKIKDKNPSYIYEDETELDFFTSDKVLIEVKYQNEMSDNQKKLFKKFNAKKKILINGFEGLKKLE
jgi:uncharacterized protein